MSVSVLRPREASMFACLVDAVASPAGALPPVGRTDAVAAFDALLAASPPVNRAGLRALLHLVELAPLALGYGTRLRRLSPERRVEALERLEAGPAALAVRPLVAVAKLSYYGDDRAARALGYDADAVVARGRALREAEVRW